MSIARLLWVGVVCVGCADHKPPQPTCWDDPASDPQVGVVELGTGDDPYTALVADQDMTLIHGPQGGHHLYVRSRIQGMDPGDPGDTLSKFSAFAEDDTKLDIFQCAFKLSYVDDGTGFLIVERGVAVIIDEQFVPTLPGTRVRLQVEVVDAKHHYATTDQLVFVRNP